MEKTMLCYVMGIGVAKLYTLHIADDQVIITAEAQTDFNYTTWKFNEEYREGGL